MTSERSKVTATTNQSATANKNETETSAATVSVFSLFLDAARYALSVGNGAFS